MPKTLSLSQIKTLNSVSYDKDGKPFIVWEGEKLHFREPLQFALVVESWNSALRGSYVANSQGD